MEARYYIVGYRPLVHTVQGRKAVERFGRPPYADYSCRSEPSLEHVHPAVTALCRGRMFAPRLLVGDTLAYVTSKSKPEYSYRLSAVLRVIHRFETHKTAADWYRSRGMSLPPNIMEYNNPALPVEQTSGIPSNVKPRTAKVWDYAYRLRARANAVVSVTYPLYVNLTDPPYALEAAPMKLNPPAVPREQFEAILMAAGVSPDVIWN